MPAETQIVIPRDWSVPAGDVLAEALTERGWTQAELARRTDRPLKTINEIVRGKTVITPDTAIQLELVLGIPAHVWLNLERNYGEAIARQKERERLDRETDWLKRFPLSDMVKHGLLNASRSKTDLLVDLLRFFRVANESAWERHWDSVPVALRRSLAFTPKAESLAAWLRWGEIQAEAIECKDFDADGLEALCDQLRTWTTRDPLAFDDELRESLANVGVALVMLPELSGTRVSGAARWLSADKALVQLSLRHKTDDHFWFSLCHELGHLVRGSRRTTYVDVHIDAPGVEDDERLADAFASDCLVPSEQYETFVRDDNVTAKTIEEFAAELKVAPGVLLGRLQHDKVVPPSRWNYLKRSIDLAN